MKRFLSILLALTLVCLAVVPSFAVTERPDTKLKFSSDGRFKILQFADCQDHVLPHRKMLLLMDRACRELRPDLVVFSGDNNVQDYDVLNRASIRQLIAPVARYGIPFAFTFGNHDAERSVTKETQMKHYHESGICMTYNADDSIHGYGNCNIPIYGKNGTDIKFNIWLIDSNMYLEDWYDIVYPDQVEWYRKTSVALEEEAGYKVPSLVFQHIAPPEVFDYFEPAPRDQYGNITTTEPTRYHKGRGETYVMKWKEDAPVEPNLLQEFPGAPHYNTNEVEVMAERGDVLGIAFGHDHINNYIVHMENGIDLIQTPGITYRAYGNDNIRGFRMFTINESDPWSYEEETFLYRDLLSESEMNNPFGNAIQFFISLKTITWAIDQTVREFFSFLK
ncbi:MAG: metallophosphoesterase [Acutalibacteraceae bacterium]